jgi:large subunit ribosomal protein L22
MAEARAVHRYLRSSPYKVRRVVDLIRGKPLVEAERILRFSPYRAARPVLKVLRSAAANAINVKGMAGERLYVARAYVDEGPTLKRWRPRALGRAYRIRKRTSHVTIVVGEMAAEGRK